MLISSLLLFQILFAHALAFPGAEGFGRHATGGRGGSVFQVTTLNDSGPNSLRAAIETGGPRTVVFRVSGTIQLQSPLVIEEGNLTIAGQTAPGDGICIRDFPVLVAADNVIVRYLRFRLGDAAHSVADALSAAVDGERVYGNIIIDHCSISWGIDECSSFYDVADFTMQWCFITESLNRSYHPKGDHGYGGIWGGLRSSFHHNLFAHHSSRTPRFHGLRGTTLRDSSLVDFRNNVIYNWGFNSAYGGEHGNHNIVANYYKHGPATNPTVRSRILQPGDSLSKWHISGNHVWSDPDASVDNWVKGVQGVFADAQRRNRQDASFQFDSVKTHSAEDAFELVLEHGGASFPERDAVDSRIVHEVRTGTATFGGFWGSHTGIIDSQADVGGWPILRSSSPPVDTDADGIPDEWELKNGLDPHDATDGAILRNDGYSNLEHYINSLVAECANHSAIR
jgi:hypothetical protein